MRVLDELTLSLPVLIKGEHGASGSGFYVRKNKKIFLVTANHVMKSKEGFFYSDNWTLTSYNHGNKDSVLEMRIDTNIVKSESDVSKDIIVVVIGEIQEDDEVEEFHWRQTLGVEKTKSIQSKIVVVHDGIIAPINNVMVSNDVYILGYPSSLGEESKFGKQIDKEGPLLRKGTISGINWKNETIILDCAAYFGNSGGIAVEIEQIESRYKYKAIGLVSQFIPFVQHSYVKEMEGVINMSIENSGYSVVVPMDTIIELTSRTD